MINIFSCKKTFILSILAAPLLFFAMAADISANTKDQEQKTYTKILPIKENAVISLPGLALTSGNYPATLSEVQADGSKHVNFNTVINTTGQVVLPQASLEQAWLASHSEFNARAFRLTIEMSGKHKYVSNVVLNNPDEKIDLPQGEIRRAGTVNRFYINGKPLNSIIGRWSYNGRVAPDKAFCPNAVKDFGQAGVHGNILILAPYKYFKGGKFDDKGFLNETEQIVTQILTEDPEARLMIQFFLFMPEEWVKDNPDELIVLDNGTKTLAHSLNKSLQPSYASQVWRDTMSNILATSVSGFRKSPFADRIITLRLLYANCGEWNNWGYHEKAFVDYSKPMQRAFGEWLQKKYWTEEKLREEWARPEVDFKSGNLVPSRQLRLDGMPILRLGGKKTRAAIDYYTFFQEYSVDTIVHFAKAVKEASGRRLLTGAYYGYYFGHYGANPYHFQDSGSYGTGHMLQSGDIDFFGGPNPYYKRLEHADINGIPGSINLHGKIWVNEGDQRTHYSGPEQNRYGTTKDLSESIAIAKRNFMDNLQNGVTYYFYDFIQNWYRDPQFMETVKKLNAIDSALYNIPRENKAEVAVLFSEEVVPYLSNQPDPSFRIFRDIRADNIDAWGVPVDNYLLSDIDKIDFSKYKALVFANSYYADEAIIQNVQKYAASKKRSLIFFYAPGIVNNNNQLVPAQSKRLTGICIKPVEISKGPKILTTGGKQITEEPYSKFTEIDDPEAEITARFADGTPACAQRQFSDYKSIVICHPIPDAAFMREILKQNGVHIYTSAESGFDDLYFAGPLTGIYSRTGGTKTITLPEKAEIAADLFTGEIFGYDIKTINLTMPPEPHTVILYTGTKENYEKFFKEIKGVKK